MGDIGTVTARATLNIKELQQGVDRAQREMRGYEQTVDKKLDQAQNRWQRYARSVNTHAGKMRQGIGSVVSKLGTLQGAMGGLAVGAGFYAVLDSYSRLDQGLTQVSKTADLTGDRLDELESNVLDMARNMGVSRDNLLNLASAAGQLGVEGVDNITNFTETVGKMQQASDLAGEEGARQLARLLNVADEGTDKVDELGSVIVRLGNNMAATEAEITKMASEIGRGTAAFEVASEQSVALGAALKAMGARAELSGSAIARSMIQIQKAIEGGGERLRRLIELTGMTRGELRQTFAEDSMEVFAQWIHGISRVSQEGRTAVGVLEEFGLSGTEAAKGLTPLIKNADQMDRALEMANEEVKNATALNEEAERANKSFAAQMRMTMNTVDEIAAKIGEGLAPTIVDLTKDFRDWVEENDELINQDIPETVDNIARSVGWLTKRMHGVSEAVKAVSEEFARGQFGPDTVTGHLKEDIEEARTRLSQLRTQLEAAQGQGGTYDEGVLSKWIYGTEEKSVGQIKEEISKVEARLKTYQKTLQRTQKEQQKTNKQIQVNSGAMATLKGQTMAAEEGVKDYTLATDRSTDATRENTGATDENSQSKKEQASAYEKVIQRLKEQIKQEEMSRAEFKKYSAIQDAEIDQYSTKADKIRSLVDELYDLRESTDSAGSGMQEAAMEGERLNDTLDKTKKKADDAGESLDQAGRKAMRRYILSQHYSTPTTPTKGPRGEASQLYSMYQEMVQEPLPRHLLMQFRRNPGQNDPFEFLAQNTHLTRGQMLEYGYKPNQENIGGGQQQGIGGVNQNVSVNIQNSGFTDASGLVEQIEGELLKRLRSGKFRQAIQDAASGR